jgi:hypothetical protein
MRDLPGRSAGDWLPPDVPDTVDRSRIRDSTSVRSPADIRKVRSVEEEAGCAARRGYARSQGHGPEVRLTCQQSPVQVPRKQGHDWNQQRLVGHDDAGSEPRIRQGNCQSLVASGVGAARVNRYTPGAAFLFTCDMLIPREPCLTS